VQYAPSKSEEQSRLESGLQQLIVEYDVDRSLNPAGDIMVSRLKFTKEPISCQLCSYVTLKAVRSHVSLFLFSNGKSLRNSEEILTARIFSSTHV
jgi:hypothetical protein